MLSPEEGLSPSDGRRSALHREAVLVLAPASIYWWGGGDDPAEDRERRDDEFTEVELVSRSVGTVQAQHRGEEPVNLPWASAAPQRAKSR